VNSWVGEQAMNHGSSCKILRIPQINFEKGQSHWKTVFLLYSTFVLLRFLIALLLVEPVVIPDELTYKSMAYGFYKWQNFFALSPEMVGAPTNIGYIFYQFVISPIFVFNGYFLIAGKLLNALVINAAIFPLYGILKNFVSQKEAALSAAIPLLLPSFGYASLLMAENIYIPLLAFFLFTIYKTCSGGSLHFSVLSAVTLLLLLLTKPHALTLLVAVGVCGGFLSLFFVFQKKDKYLGRKILISLGIIFSLLVIFAAVFLLLSKDSFPRIFGFASTVMQNISKEIAGIIGTGAFDPKSFIRMTLTHLGGLSILLLLPLLVTVWAWIDSFKSCAKNRLVFLTFGLFIFLEFFALVLLASIYFSPNESFVRLHGRFLSVIFFFFIISFAAFRKKMEWTKSRKITLGVLSLLTALILIPGRSLYFKFPAKFMLPIDYPEMCWLAFLPPAVVAVVIVLFCLMTIRIIVQNNSKPYFFYFIVLAIIANGAETQALLQTFQPQRLLTRPARTFIAATIRDQDSRVAVFDREVLYGNLTVFWLPYNFTRAKFNIKDDVLKREDIPADTDYAILYGEYVVDFIPVWEIREGKCNILCLREKAGFSPREFHKSNVLQEKNKKYSGKFLKINLFPQRARIWRREKSQMPMAK
jgi:hypothetical protein